MENSDRVLGCQNDCAAENVCSNDDEDRLKENPEEKVDSGEGEGEQVDNKAVEQEAFQHGEGHEGQVETGDSREADEERVVDRSSGEADEEHVANGVDYEGRFNEGEDRDEVNNGEQKRARKRNSRGQFVSRPGP